MKVIIDNKIPYIKGALESFAEVIYLPGKETTPEIVKDADALITRTRTICNEKLLAGSKVKMIATATIGFDHIDTVYCEKAGIEWTNAPGCNSWSVAQYIMAALHTMAIEKKLQLSELTIGIIGAGNVGSKIARLCSLIGMNVLVNDPPRQKKEGDAGFVSLLDIQQKADIITVHTPFTYEGEDKTYHLLDEKFIYGCEKDIFLINSARGEIMDTQAIVAALKFGKIKEAIIDCWENEPLIDYELLEHTFISTPHIAGYSRDGKANGTRMSVRAVSRKFGLGIDNWECNNVEIPENSIILLEGRGKTNQGIVAEAILKTYPIMEDNKRLKFSPLTFEKQRGDYPVRREFPVYTIQPVDVNPETLKVLGDLGFQF
jgi:erythronate-4-phosphate dehydrogenase